MFFVGNTIISDDLATFKFACDLGKCKGACCVVGSAGAPVKASEIPVLRRAFEELKSELRPEAVEVVEQSGLVHKHRDGYELACTNGAECVFVKYDQFQVATCAIQQAFEEGRFNWPKPISCHLFPVRVTALASQDMLNVEYVPSICSPACDRGHAEDIGLAEFLKEPLIRAYGAEWYDEFVDAIIEVRNSIGHST